MYSPLVSSLVRLIFLAFLPEVVLSLDCTEDAWYSAMQVFSFDALTFCRSYLPITPVTRTADTITPYATTFSTRTILDTITTLETDSTTETITSTITDAPELKVKRNDLNSEAAIWIERAHSIARAHRAPLVRRGDDAAAARSLTSACECNRFAPSTTIIVATADTSTRTLGVINFRTTTVTSLTRLTQLTTVLITATSLSNISTLTSTVTPATLSTTITSIPRPDPSGFSSILSSLINNTVTTTSANNNLSTTSRIPTSSVTFSSILSSLISNISPSATGNGSSTLFNVSTTVPASGTGIGSALPTNATSNLLPTATNGNLSISLNISNTIPTTIAVPTSLLSSITNSSFLPTTTNGNLSISLNISSTIPTTIAVPTSLLSSITNSSLFPTTTNGNLSTSLSINSNISATSAVSFPTNGNFSTSLNISSTIPTPIVEPSSILSSEPNGTQTSRPSGSGASGSRTGLPSIRTTNIPSPTAGSNVTADLTNGTSATALTGFPSEGPTSPLFSVITIISATTQTILSTITSLPSDATSALSDLTSSATSLNDSTGGVSEVSTSFSTSIITPTLPLASTSTTLNGSTGGVSEIPTSFSTPSPSIITPTLPVEPFPFPLASTSTFLVAECIETSPILNPSFERRDGNLIPPWVIFSNSSAIRYRNVPGTLESPSYDGARHAQIVSNSDDDFLTMSQSLLVCPDVAYDFSAWTRIPQPSSGCSVLIRIGGFPVAFKNSNMIDDPSEYQDIVGVYGPWDATAVDVVITVQCTNTTNLLGGQAFVDIDNVTLTIRDLDG